MKKIVIKGGKKLKGDISISGAKNSALPIMAASLLTKEEIVLHNVPRLEDIKKMANVLHNIGVKINFDNNIIKLKSDKIKTNGIINNSSTREIRYSTHLIGALLPQIKKIIIPLPGGCKIGTRRIDSHILGLSKLGANVDVTEGRIKVSADELKGSQMKFEYPSVGATENIMIAACLAENTTTIENVAKEPEIVDLANFLNSMGGDIRGAGTDVIRINGVKKLYSTEHTLIPDRIETGTYIVAAAITKGDVLIKNADLNLLESVVSKMHKVGVNIEESIDGIRVTSSERFDSTDVVTEVYPGFPTDMQPIITPLLALAKGESTIKETIFDNRFNHVPELLKMGAKMKVEGDTIFISGVKKLIGANVESIDIRSGGGLMLAGLSAKGRTIINEVNQILRGYENPIEKLRGIGAEIHGL